MSVRCIFCGNGLPGDEALLQHVLVRHGGRKLAKGRVLCVEIDVAADPGPNSRFVQCWCGWQGREYFWQRHIKNRGGIESHILEIGFGWQHGDD